MADTKGPGDPGTTVGQIKTPMCSANVGDKGGGKTHAYKDMPSGKGNGASIKGPGAKGQWTAGVNISGSNLKY